MANNLERQMEVFGRWLSVIVVFIIVAAFLLARFRAKESWQGAFEVRVGRVRVCASALALLWLQLELQLCRGGCL